MAGRLSRALDNHLDNAISHHDIYGIRVMGYLDPVAVSSFGRIINGAMRWQ